MTRPHPGLGRTHGMAISAHPETTPGKAACMVATICGSSTSASPGRCCDQCSTSAFAGDWGPSQHKSPSLPKHCRPAPQVTLLHTTLPRQSCSAVSLSCSAASLSCSAASLSCIQCKSACNAIRPRLRDCHAAVCCCPALSVSPPVMQSDHTSVTVMQQCVVVMHSVSVRL